MSWLMSEAMMKAYGNLPCSPERAAESSPGKCSDGEPSAPSNGKPTQRAYLQRDKTTDTWSRFPSGMTCEPLTEADGEAVLTSFLGAFPAKRSAARLEGVITRPTYGPKCLGLSEKAQLQLPLPRMSQSELFRKPQTIYEQLDTKPQPFPFPRLTWVLTTFGIGTGLLHTPTTQANYSAASMQKWGCCRSYVKAFGKAHPEADEYLMGWPIGWSDIEPLETAKSLSARQPHSSRDAGD